MKTLTPGQALEQVAAGAPDPVYLILGDDELEKAEVADSFEQIVDEGLRAFNVERLHGMDASLGDVVEATRTLPMMASRRVVILRRAELALVLDGGAAPYMVLGQLAWVARTKLPPGRVSPAVEAMFETDLALKSSAGDQRVLLERLVLEMCGVGLPRSAGASS